MCHVLQKNVIIKNTSLYRHLFYIPFNVHLFKLSFLFVSVCASKSIDRANAGTLTLFLQLCSCSNVSPKEHLNSSISLCFQPLSIIETPTGSGRYHPEWFKETHSMLEAGNSTYLITCLPNHNIDIKSQYILCAIQKQTVLHVSAQCVIIRHGI